MTDLQNLDEGNNESGDLSAQAVIKGLRSDFWKKIICYESVDSTNESALALSLNSPESRIVIISDSQAKGRGRLGRAWVSPPGRNIYMSAVLIPEIKPKNATFLTIAPALASASALRSKTGLTVKIKWPNDLMVRGRKIGGLLTELRSGNGKIKFAIMGMGINVNSGGEDFKGELGQIATSVKEETGRSYARSAIIAEILNELEQWYWKLINQGRLPLLEEWRNLSSTIGKEVRINLTREVLSGLAEDIDSEGMLVLKSASGEKRRISAGDLMELR